MDLYLLNPDTYLKDVSIDVYTSFIFTERYNEAGDFVLVISENSVYATLLTEGAFLAIDGSKEVMMIDGVSRENKHITLVGKTMIDIFSQRLFRNQWQTTTDSWAPNPYSASVLARSFVQHMAMPGYLMDNDSIVPSGYGSQEIFPNLSVAPAIAGDAITIAVPYGDLFSAIKQTCDLDNIGFSLYPVDLLSGTGNIIFVTYRGRDLTSYQTVYDPVIFEPALDTITNIKQVRSISGYKTHAYAWASGITAQSQIGRAVAPGASSLIGFKRRTIMVTASDVTATDYSAADLLAILNKKAMDALINNNYVRVTDGQIVPQMAYTYGVDYHLGDVVELRGTTNDIQKARVIEYIRAEDSTGERAYPTLSAID